MGFRTGADAESTSQLSLDQIFNGKGAFEGLIPICKRYLKTSSCTFEERSALEGYLDFVSRRANGSTVTGAAWMRKFVMSHPAYKRDSRIPAEAAHDLVRAASEVGAEQRPCP